MLDFADAIAEVREQILELAAEIAASVAIGAGFAVFTAGISAAAVTATTARLVAMAARLGITLRLRAAIIGSRVTAVAGMESLATNTVVQAGSGLAFNQNHNPLEGFELLLGLWNALGGSGAGSPGTAAVGAGEPAGRPLSWPADSAALRF